MDLALFFVLPLIGGFYFVTQLSLLRYKTSREESQRLYYRAAFIGVCLAAISALVHEIGERSSAGYSRFAMNIITNVLTPLLEKERGATTSPLSAQAQAIRVEAALVCVYAFGLGAITPVWNRCLQLADWVWLRLPGRRPRRSFLEKLNLRAITDLLEQLLARSLLTTSLIQVTLSNSKVYVGSVLTSPDPSSPAKYFMIQPWMSGHREEDGRVTFNTLYDDVLLEFQADPAKHAVVETFQLVIPVDKVITASGFNLEAYVRFLQERDSETEAALPPNGDLTS